MKDEEFIRQELALLHRHNLANARILTLTDRWNFVTLGLVDKDKKENLLKLYERLVKLNERFVTGMEAVIEQGEAEVRDLQGKKGKEDEENQIC